MFIVAACNPYRSDSMATHTEETWVRGNYNVRPLHPTLELLMWDYRALEEEQEEDYICGKIRMLNQELADMKVVVLAQLIVESQKLMRKYASQQLQKLMQKAASQQLRSKKIRHADAEVVSLVSQRPFFIFI